ncbi:hypothetical protein KUTeg_000129 [Tegillarca granosa]|uniref:Double-strand-break repair protein rad21 homolog n=1 Tax=Tegillarca granosa TaxID=220873 RepID=A0ABQ9G117_TEGGR|nr:hypothetical protein KUTeg_000129 [Tegillarca granosa]
MKMFYAHFVLSKKGPLARIWLAAHWDKKVTKAHVFETNIDSSVEAIMQPKVKLALRTSGHLLLGVVRIYSRKAKYLLADCNEAFVKIKMAFRPGVVDLPEENREAAVAAITLQENFDFDTTLADLNDLDVQAQFSVNQSRPEEITMREDLSSIAFVGDDGFGIMDGFGADLCEEDMILIICGNSSLSLDSINLYKDKTNKAWDVLSESSKPCKPRINKLDSGIGMESDDDYDNYDDLSEHESDKEYDQNDNYLNSLHNKNSCNKCDSTQDKKYSKSTSLPPPTYKDNYCQCKSTLGHSNSKDHQPDDISRCGSCRGDVGFDDREILRDAASIEDSLYKQPHERDLSAEEVVEEKEKTLNENATQNASSDKPMDIDLEAPVHDDGFGGAVDGGFMGDDDFMQSAGGLFEDAPMADVSMAPPVEEAQAPASGQTEVAQETSKLPEEAEPAQPQHTSVATGASGEQTTLINNEEEAFALPPLDATVVPGTGGTERRGGKRKRKLIVDEQKGIPSETMKLQLSDTSDVVTTLDLAPPTKKLMHWKETGGVEKLFALPGRSIVSKMISKLFTKNMVTKRISEEEDLDDERILLESTEIARQEETVLEKSRTIRDEISTIVEEPSVLDASTKSVDTSTKRSRKSERQSKQNLPPTPAPPTPKPVDVSNAQDLFATTFNEGVVDMPGEPTMLNDQTELNQNIDPYDADPPSIAPFSVPPPSVPPPSVPPSDAPTFHEEIDPEAEAMPENEEQEEKRWSKRTQQMQHSLEIGFRYRDPLSFKEMSRNLNRKQACSKFYTLLVLKKHQAIEVDQPQPFGDIFISKGAQFGIAC